MVCLCGEGSASREYVTHSGMPRGYVGTVLSDPSHDDFCMPGCQIGCESKSFHKLLNGLLGLVHTSCTKVPAICKPEHRACHTGHRCEWHLRTIQGKSIS